MKKYDYLEAVTNDVKGYIQYNVDMSDYSDRDELAEYLNEHLFCNDSVTGNASGSYTFNTWKAEENLCHNLDLLGEALSEFGCDPASIMDSPESCDVTIRCYLLGQAINAALDELWEDNEDDEDESDEYED